MALVEEAIELRRAGIDKPILVWGQAYEGAYELIVRFNLTPVLCTVDQFEALSAAVKGATWKVHVEVDTGMARAGVPCCELSAFVKSVVQCKNVTIDGLMTHPANVDSPSDAFNRTQLQRWREALEIAASCGLNPTWLHFANSPGALSLPKAGANLVRCGLALYGVDPLEGKCAPVKLTPALRWTTEVVAVRTLQAGEPVSYGAEWHADHESQIATLAVGYGDGYMRALSNKAYVLVRGRRARLVGTVCMDYCMIDVTHVPGVTRGDEVVLLGEQQGATIDATEVAEWAGTISYEIVCNIGRRVPRRYVGGPR